MTSKSGDSFPSPTLDWKFSQVFGESVPGEDLQEVDAVSAIAFDKTGDYLAVGDRGGRIVIFERKDGKDASTPNQYLSRNELEQLDFTVKNNPEYRYKTEFQSHEPEFDYMKSLEIEEKINRTRWCPTSNGSLFILSTNNKTIKLWKIKENKIKKVKDIGIPSAVFSENDLLAEKSFTSGPDKLSAANGYNHEGAPYQDMQNKIAYAEETSRAFCRKVYAHAHDFNINSISNNSDGETFISADELRINLWNLEIGEQCFNIIDMKPSNMEDLTEVITAAEFHPIHCNLLAYSSSRGFIRVVDMRQSALCDRSARILNDAEYHGSKSFFTEITASISDIKFTNNGQHILSRDYMNLKLWDIRMDSLPVSVFKIHDHLQYKLSDLYNDDSIFDKFECCISGDGLYFATGSYSNLLRIFSNGVGNGEGITVETSKRANRTALLHPAPKVRRSSLSNLTRGFYRKGLDNSSSDSKEISCDLSSKLLHVAWHPATNLIACASGNSLLLYYS